MDREKKKYMVVCVAGQSNAVGYDESVITKDDWNRLCQERICQLGFYGEDNLKIIPLGPCAQSYQDMRPYSNPQNELPDLGTKGIHLPLAHLLLPYIPEEYSILMISCAYGGTAFTSGETGEYHEENKKPSPGILRWGVNSPYYLALKDRIRYALDLNQENRFLGVVWIQGESDYENGAQQIRLFDQMAEDFLQSLKQYGNRVKNGAWDKRIWYTVETVDYWRHMGDCQAIWDHYRQWNPFGYVEIDRSTDSNEINGTGLTASQRASHFGNNAFEKVIAPAVFHKMLENGGIY